MSDEQILLSIYYQQMPKYASIVVITTNPNTRIFFVTKWHSTRTCNTAWVTQHFASRYQDFI
jgi:hypothetical protein